MFPMTEKAKYFPTVELFQAFIVLRPPTASCQPTESRLQNDCEIKWHPSLHTTLNSAAPLALTGNPHRVTTFLESEYILWSRNYESYVGSQGETNRIYKINHSITVSTDSYHFERVFFFFSKWSLNFLRCEEYSALRWLNPGPDLFHTEHVDLLNTAVIKATVC